MIPFEKIHGTGNDFILFNGMTEKFPSLTKLAQQVCDRHFGIGADGILVALPTRIADIRMVYHNADGSEAPMCGNGIRCFAKFVYENKIITKSVFNVETLAGIMTVRLSTKDNKVEKVKIGLGSPIFDATAFPIATQAKAFINQVVMVLDRQFVISALNMGTIHVVTFVDDLNQVDVLKYGPLIENLPLFPKKTNVNFCQVIDDETIKIKTWERGAGHTLACGTGACASAVIGYHLNKTKAKVHVESPGGVLLIEIEGKEVYLTGPAQRVCQGYYIDEGVL